MIAFVMALLSSQGIGTPSLPAQGEQRRLILFQQTSGHPPIAWIANFVGMAWGLTVLLAAIERNTQGTIIDQTTGAFDYRSALILFVAWFLVAAIATAIALSILLLLAEGLFLLARWLFRRSA
jgi:uncharacterized membrane protein